MALRFRTNNSKSIDGDGPGPTAERDGYFPHIDVLRAIAIIPVVLYHLVPRWCPGGYAGVDVFFVISGFLITRRIVDGLKKGGFTVGDFYAGRIRRILPAYFVVMICALAGFLARYSFSDYSALCRTAIYSAAYSANLYFAEGVGYFDLDARLNPLLHLWSLGVECQFYLILPPLILFLWRVCGKRIWVGVYALCGASFVFGMLKIGAGDFRSAYFLLPSRAWELLAGSILAQVAIGSSRRHDGLLRALGLGLVLIPYICYDDSTPFPGVGALPSVVGACLWIVYGGRQRVGRIDKALCHVGKVSYSLYLWHWPVFIFCEASNTLSGGIVGVAGTIGATLLSYHCIERPARTCRLLAARNAFFVLAGGSAVLVAFCLLVLMKKDVNGDLARKWNGRDTWFLAEQKREPGRSEASVEELKTGDKLIPIGAEQARPHFVVWGDSHALALLPGFDFAAKEYGQAGYFLNLKHGLTMRAEIGGYAFDPVKDREPVFRWLEGRPDIVEVYLVNYWFSQLRDRSDVAQVVSICERLLRAGKKPIFFRNLPLASEKALACLQWGFGVDPVLCSYKIEEYNRRSVLQDDLAAILSARGLATVMDIDKAFLSGDAGAYITVVPPVSYYIDSHHVNSLGAIRAIGFVAPKLWPSP